VDYLLERKSDCSRLHVLESDAFKQRLQISRIAALSLYNVFHDARGQMWELRVSQ
jgi:hypothetical protein